MVGWGGFGSGFGFRVWLLATYLVNVEGHVLVRGERRRDFGEPVRGLDEQHQVPLRHGKTTTTTATTVTTSSVLPPLEEREVVPLVPGERSPRHGDRTGFPPWIGGGGGGGPFRRRLAVGRFPNPNGFHASSAHTFGLEEAQLGGTAEAAARVLRLPLLKRVA